MILLTRQQLAEKLNIKYRKVMELEKEGLPVVRFGTHTPRYNLDQVLAWIQEKQDMARDIN